MLCTDTLVTAIMLQVCTTQNTNHYVLFGRVLIVKSRSGREVAYTVIKTPIYTTALFTVKGVNFFGPGSQYVVSGSDCGNIFFWHRETEAIVQCMAGDENGVVCIRDWGRFGDACQKG